MSRPLAAARVRRPLRVLTRASCASYVRFVCALCAHVHMPFDLFVCFRALSAEVLVDLPGNMCSQSITTCMFANWLLLIMVELYW